ncbi:hypothetical protein BKA70DRAFT_1418179 [Coprinopsis sp. MPI-PUGE-AT-0042]|nr:hypothetical protein BKA70DRAFT_1418179 [Coprinopsis sp. MPI-PUGE-AT-0042]
MKSLLTATVLLGLQVISAMAEEVPVWGQCGGIGFEGTTACASGCSCVALREWYHQCRPGGPITITTPPVASPTTKLPSIFSCGAPLCSVTTIGTACPSCAAQPGRTRRSPPSGPTAPLVHALLEPPLQGPVPLTLAQDAQLDHTRLSPQSAQTAHPALVLPGLRRGFAPRTRALVAQLEHTQRSPRSEPTVPAALARPEPTSCLFMTQPSLTFRGAMLT